MGAVANSTGLGCPSNGLSFVPCGYHGMAKTLKPASEGGISGKPGIVDVVSSIQNSGEDVFKEARFGVLMVLEAHSDFQKECFMQYGLEVDASGRYATQYKSISGLEVGLSVASIMCRGEPTGQTKTFAGNVIAIARRNLKADEELDGEGGYTVVGQLIPAERSLAIGALLVCLAHGLKLRNEVNKGQSLLNRRGVL